MKARPCWGIVVALALGPGTSLAAERAGVAGGVRGQVTLERAQRPAQPVSSGEEIFMQDDLRTGPRSAMQILLLDQTTFTIGPDSAVVVDEFVYDAATGAGRVSARVAKGVFRFVTGRIAARQPADLNVALPAGNIGVRGTMAVGRSDAQSAESLVVLVGEGKDNTVGDPGGAIDVCNAGTCSEVSRTGFGVRIPGRDEPPSEPFRVPESELAGLLRELGDPEDLLAAREVSGADAAVDPDQAGPPPPDEERAKTARRELRRLDSLYEVSILAQQDERDEEAFALGLQGIESGIPDGPTTYDQLRSLPAGQIHYTETAVKLTTPDTYSFLLNIDLGARTYGGGGSYSSVSGTYTGFTPYPSPTSFASDSGNVDFVLAGTAIGGGPCGMTCNTVLSIRPQNVGGDIGAVAEHSMQVFDFSSVLVDQGSGVTPKQPGFVP